MKRLFNINNPIFRAIGRIGDFILLSILWLLTSLPVITVGASSAALVSVASLIVRNNEVSVIRDFFREFRRAFVPSLGVWLCLLAAGIILSIDIYFWANNAGSIMGLVLSAFSIGLALIYALTVLYIFPVMAMYDGVSFKDIFIGSMLISVKSIFGSLSMLLCIGAAIFLCTTIPIVLYVFLLIGPGIIAWIFSFRFLRTIEKYGSLIRSGNFRDEFSEQEDESEE